MPVAPLGQGWGGMTARRREVLGYYMRDEPLTQREIAKLMGITAPRVGQLRSWGLKLIGLDWREQHSPQAVREALERYDRSSTDQD